MGNKREHKYIIKGILWTGIQKESVCTIGWERESRIHYRSKCVCVYACAVPLILHLLFHVCICVSVCVCKRRVWSDDKWENKQRECIIVRISQAAELPSSSVSIHGESGAERWKGVYCETEKCKMYQQKDGKKWHVLIGFSFTGIWSFLSKFLTFWIVSIVA